MKKTAKELDHVLERWLEEHKRKRNSATSTCEPDDFMDMMLSLLDDSIQEFRGYITADTINKLSYLPGMYVFDQFGIYKPHHFFWPITNLIIN